LPNVAVKGPDARARNVSWHYTADDVRVVQHLPDDEVGWHAKSGNSKSLGVEICQHAGIDQAAANARAALLIAVLLKRHGLGIDAVVSHKFWTGKQCPRVILESAGGFQSFVDLVSQQFAQIEDVAAFAAADSVRHTAREALAQYDPSRVRMLEELLGRAIADAEILRRQLAEVRDEAYEAP
jgi:N-acetylmuramoyl-L-alanine amidase CwlA